MFNVGIKFLVTVDLYVKKPHCIPLKKIVLHPGISCIYWSLNFSTLFDNNLYFFSTSHEVNDFHLKPNFETEFQVSLFCATSLRISSDFNIPGMWILIVFESDSMNTPTLYISKRWFFE